MNPTSASHDVREVSPGEASAAGRGVAQIRALTEQLAEARETYVRKRKATLSAMQAAYRAEEEAILAALDTARDDYTNLVADLATKYIADDPHPEAWNFRPGIGAFIRGDEFRGKNHHTQ